MNKTSAKRLGWAIVTLFVAIWAMEDLPVWRYYIAFIAASAHGVLVWLAFERSELVSRLK